MRRHVPVRGLNPATASAPSQTPAKRAVMTSRKISASKIAMMGGSSENHGGVSVGSSSCVASPMRTWSGSAAPDVIRRSCTTTESCASTVPPARLAPSAVRISKKAEASVPPSTVIWKGTPLRITDGGSETSCAPTLIGIEASEMRAARRRKRMKRGSGLSRWRTGLVVGAIMGIATRR